MSHTIESLMQREVWSVGPDEPVQAIENLMAARDLTWVPVVDKDSGVLGVVSASDLLRLHAEGKTPSSSRAWQLCTFKPVTVRPDATAGEVARLMLEAKVHHVVVVGADGAMLGVLSSLDLLRVVGS